MRAELPAGPWLVVGLGRSGLAAAQALAARGETVVAVDTGSPDVGDASFEVVLDSDGLGLLDGAAAVVKSPGVPPSAPVVAAARASGKPVIGELELAWRLTDCPVVAVTGTNGKTTVTEWLGHVLRCAGRDALVVGNVGTPFASAIGAPASAVAVVECSSFQLADTELFRPEVGVLLNLGSDHLDWHGTVERYREAKLAGMFSRQLARDVAVAPAGVELTGAARRIVLDEVELPGEPGLPGAHNVANARAVTAAARAVGVGDAAVAEGLATFRGVEHRLEDLGIHAGVRYINDSKATNVASTLTALAAMDAPVHLIAGGDDAKNEDFSPLRPAVRERCASVQLIGEAAARMQAAIGTGEDRETLERAVAGARAAARPGDVVLLSPACASYDQFENFEARGAAFKELVA